MIYVENQPTNLELQARAKLIALKLLAYCRAEEWAGYDPYDALNSRLLSSVPLLNQKLPRLVLTQALKRSPVDLRRMLGVPKTQNPKGLALLLSAFLKFSKQDLPDRDALVHLMIERLSALRSSGTNYSCWGYSFPWQTRKDVVPAGTPNLVCTVFVADALLDAYDATGDARGLEMATSAAEYILNELYWSDGKSVHSFSYPLPSVKVQVYNANLLAAALLCRVAHVTGRDKFVSPALRATRCAVAKQKADGSWDYGDLESQRWIDNFHTGFNLGALHSIGVYTGSSEFADSLRRGFAFYTANFFRGDGAPKYFHNATYPIDAHCVAQSLITLTEFQYLDSASASQAGKVFQWALQNMWDERGFFYYRVLRLLTIRASYMRWTQAWMLLALATFARGAQSNREIGASDRCADAAPALARGERE